MKMATVGAAIKKKNFGLFHYLSLVRGFSNIVTVVVPLGWCNQMSR